VIDLKAVAAGTLISAGTALAALGLGTGIANATPISPMSAGPQVLADNGPGHGHGHGHGDDWWWDGPGPRNWDPVDACIGVQGPFGFVQGSACV
jgi:hypothetical protein